MTEGSSNWLEFDSYYLSTDKQGTVGWASHRGKRLTASIFGEAVGHGYNPPDKLLEYFRTGTRDIPDEYSQFLMNEGTRVEPIARDWYISFTGNKVQEVGLAVPKWDTRIGSSSDGLVGKDGVIEIKSPKGMYPLLTKRLIDIACGKTFDKFDHSHINPTHYDQIQGTLAILSRQWCDYIVYDELNGKVYLERVSYNKRYWEEELYPELQKFITKIYE